MEGGTTTAAAGERSIIAGLVTVTVDPRALGWTGGWTLWTLLLLHKRDQRHPIMCSTETKLEILHPRLEIRYLDFTI